MSIQLAPVIRWGIIGCGKVCEVKSGPGFQEADGSTLTMVMRRTPLMAEDFATRHGVPNWSGDVDTLIEDEDVDAVYIATPPGTHCEYALRVCKAGKPCYVEKPMARNGAECDRMVKAFSDAGVPLFVAYYRRALPRFLKAKELIDSGALGDIESVIYQYESMAEPSKDLGWRVDVEESGGGLFLDLGSHTLDILDFLLGPLRNVSGEASNHGRMYKAEDRVTLRFGLDNGATGVAKWNFFANQYSDEICIKGSKSSLRLGTFGNEPIVLEEESGDQETFDLPNPRVIQQPLIQTIVDSLRNGSECPSTGETAARTSHVMDKALESYYGGRSDDFWARPDTWPGGD